jgi:signal transduction histidine kinase
VSASLGIALYPEDGGDAATLVSRADTAMYRCKSRGRGNFGFYNEKTLGSLVPASPIVDVLQQPVTAYEIALADHETHLLNLREANERLMIAALNAQALESQAKEANHRQIKFQAMVAHELRNPLTPIRTAAELLTRARTDEPMLARLQVIIKRQVAYMTRLVDDLLDGSRLSAGKFRIAHSVVEITDILELALEIGRPAMEARLQQFALELPPRPLKVHGDPVRLAQIFSNLLDNASKYTPQGGQIALSAAVLGETIVITVADNGIGIAPAALPNIFGLFVQDTRALALHNGGLGIGLAVVRELVEAHHGTVVGKSAGKGLGSEFVVTLPMIDTKPAI